MKLSKPTIGRFSLVLGIATSVALAAVRCSPISPSVSKYRNGNVGPVKTDTPFDGSLSGIVPGQQSSNLQEIPVALFEDDGDATQSATEESAAFGALPKAQLITLSATSMPADFNDFINTQSVLVRFSGTPPDDCQAFLGLNLSQKSIALHGANIATLDCVPISEGVWQLSMSTDQNADWAWIKTSLASVTLYAGYLSGNPGESVGNSAAPTLTLSNPKTVALTAAKSSTDKTAGNGVAVSPSSSPVPSPSPNPKTSNWHFESLE